MAPGSHDIQTLTLLVVSRAISLLWLPLSQA
jgi:hypothetical protein